jgi:molybdopterin synthase catalytic subunit
MTEPVLVSRALDATALLTRVSDHAIGATALFVGTVRAHNDGRPVTGIDYSAYDAMADRELRAIGAEAELRWPGLRVALEHRLGTLTVGEASVAVACAHERRGPTFEGLRYVVEELKRRVPIWKREHYADGTREWVDPSVAAAV